MSEKKTHWKKMTDTNYLGSWDVDDKLTVTIKEVKNEMLKSSPQSPEENCIVAHFEGYKPMVLNKTNCKAIQKRVGSPHIEDWIGQEITIYVAKVKAFGEMHDALRVEDFAPKKKTKSKIDDATYKKAIDACLSGKRTFEQIDKNFILSDAQAKELKEAVESFKNNQ